MARICTDLEQGWSETCIAAADTEPAERTAVETALGSLAGSEAAPSQESETSDQSEQLLSQDTAADTPLPCQSESTCHMFTLSLL